MTDRERLAEAIFHGLMAADGLDGDIKHLTSLAKRSFAAADAFLAVRDADAGPNGMASQAVPRAG